MIAEGGINAKVRISPDLRLAAIYIVIARIAAMPGHVAAQQHGVGLFRRNLFHQPSPHLGICRLNLEGIGKAHVAVNDDPQGVGEVTIADPEVRPFGWGKRRLAARRQGNQEQACQSCENLRRVNSATKLFLLCSVSRSDQAGDGCILICGNEIAMGTVDRVPADAHRIEFTEVIVFVPTLVDIARQNDGGQKDEAPATRRKPRAGAGQV